MLDNLMDWHDEWALVLSNGTVSDETRTVYLRGVRQFLTWIAEHYPDVDDVSGITERHGNAWLTHLVQEGRKEATRRVRILAVRFWFDYLIEQADSGVTTNPLTKIDLPVPKDTPVPIIPDDELTALLKTAVGSDYVSLRDTAILRVLIDTGARRGELVGIDTDDLDIARQEVTVTGKGGRTRILPLSGKTALALRKYLRVRSRRPAAGSPALFLSTRADERGRWRLTGGAVADMLDRRCRAAGIPHRWPHQLRHTWAHDMLDNGAAEQSVERLGGWSPGSKMVKRYGSSMADERARKASKEMARGDRV